jgi:hypothetical protein
MYLLAERESCSAEMERDLHIYCRERGIYRQAGLTYWQAESLAVQKWRGICTFIVGKGAYTERQALLTGRQRVS